MACDWRIMVESARSVVGTQTPPNMHIGFGLENLIRRENKKNQCPDIKFQKSKLKDGISKFATNLVNIQMQGRNLFGKFGKLIQVTQGCVPICQ